MSVYSTSYFSCVIFVWCVIVWSKQSHCFVHLMSRVIWNRFRRSLSELWKNLYIIVRCNWLKSKFWALCAIKGPKKKKSVIAFHVPSTLDSNLKNMVKLEHKENIGVCHNMAILITLSFCLVCYIGWIRVILFETWKNFDIIVRCKCFIFYEELSML